MGVIGDSGGAILADGGYSVSSFFLAKSEMLLNRASNGPAVAQVGNTEDDASLNTTFIGLEFDGNTLLCGDNEFLHSYTNVSSASCERFVSHRQTSLNKGFGMRHEEFRLEFRTTTQSVLPQCMLYRIPATRYEY